MIHYNERRFPYFSPRVEHSLQKYSKQILTNINIYVHENGTCLRLTIHQSKQKLLINSGQNLNHIISLL